MQLSEAAIVPPAVMEEATHSFDILSNIYFKNCLRNDYKKRLTCFCGHYGYYLEFVCVVVTALSCGFLNIMRQTNGGILDIKSSLWNKRNICCVTGSLMSENIRRSSKVSNFLIAFQIFVT